jgi:hypothetical protein
MLLAAAGRVNYQIARRASISNIALSHSRVVDAVASHERR